MKGRTIFSYSLRTLVIIVAKENKKERKKERKKEKKKKKEMQNVLTTGEKNITYGENHTYDKPFI